MSKSRSDGAHLIYEATPYAPKDTPQQTMSTAIVQPADPPPAAKTPEAGIVRQVTEEKQTPIKSTTGIVEIEPATPRPLTLSMPGQLPELIQAKNDSEPIVLALDQLLKGRHQDALKHLAAYDAGKQELLLRLLPIIETLVKKRIDELSTQDVAVVSKQLDGLYDAFRPRSELLVARMCCCKEVRGYAWYVPLAENHTFVAGTAERIGEQVRLYVELRNFASERTKDGEFVTRLSCALELRDAKKVVWEKRFEGNETTLRRSARLHDLYCLYGFYVPAIPAGTYQLTLKIADETNPKAVRLATRSLEFRVAPIASPPSLR